MTETPRSTPPATPLRSSAAIFLLASLLFTLTLPLSARELRHEVVLDLPVRSVWHLFTTEEGVESWMVAQAKVDLRVGGSFRTSYSPEVDLQGEEAIVNRILSYEPERMISIQNVQAPPGFDKPELFQQTWSVVRFEPLGPSRTRVVITGLGYGEGEDWDRLYEFFDKGNAFLLTRLQEVANRKAAEMELAAGEAQAAASAGERVAARGREALERVKRLVGGTWVHHSEMDGQPLRVRNVIRPGPGADSLTARGYLGLGGEPRYHAASQLWLDPGSGELRFQSLDEHGGIARGGIRPLGDDGVVWDWNVTTAEGELVPYRAETVFRGPDRYEMTLVELAGHEEVRRPALLFERMEEAATPPTEAKD